MWGPVQPTIDNPEHRNAEEGVSHRVGVLYAHSQNGGVPSKIRARDLAVITGGITLATKVLDLVATAVT